MHAGRPATAEGTNVEIAGLLASFTGRTARIGIVGLGYVGIPLALACARAGSWSLPVPARASL